MFCTDRYLIGNGLIASSSECLFCIRKGEIVKGCTTEEVFQKAFKLLLENDLKVGERPVEAVGQE